MGDRRSGAEDFHSERDQITAMRDAVQKVGGELHILPSELDVSGGLPLERRPSLRAAVEGVETGEYRGIVVAYQSRLGRDVEQEEAVWRRVERAGGQILLALDGIDASTVDGKMVRRIRSAINHAERDRHVERFDVLRREATAAGVWQRRQTPRGYDRDPSTRCLVANDVAADVRWAFAARAQGLPMVQIARRLGMTPSGVRQLLRNRVYLGELRVGSYVNAAAHEAIVDEAMFEAAQGFVPRPPRAVEGPALLAGLVRCAGCGHVMTRSRAKVLVYVCPRVHSGGACPRPASITARLLDEHVERLALTELARVRLTSTEGRGVEVARRRLEEAEIELRAYLRAVSAAGVGEDVFAFGARERREAVDRARSGLRGELGRRALVPVVQGGVEAWRLLDGHERNAVLRGLLSCVVVARAGGRGARVRLEDRVRVLRAGAELVLPVRGGGVASGVVPIALDDLSGPHLLRELAGEDAS